jgi:arylsulfatase A-like enzyme/Flp pilus assembly protein TadD
MNAMSTCWRRRILATTVGLTFLGACAFWFRPERPINLVLITLDTTRADCIGCYGYRPASTPVLDDLAARGVLFETAYAACPVTLPSHATMFTGLAPREHGIHHNGTGGLSAGIATLPDMLRSRLYETGGFVGAFVLNRKFGLNRGFQEYDDSTGAEFAEGGMQRRRSGRLVVDAALAWLKGRTSRPFFCWVHLFDPHAPYRPRQELFGDQFVERPYDAGIAAVDGQVGRIIDFLDRHNLRKRTLIVVVGDHGEGLGEHEEREHGHMLYNSTLRVPLIVAHPALCKPGHRVTEPISLVELLPMLEECLGLEVDAKRRERSLKAALHGENLPTRPCYAETDIPFLEHRWAPQRSLVSENWKYIRSPRPELYDLSHDPAELKNLAESRPERLREMEGVLAKMEAGLPPRDATDVALSPAERRTLASLGYAANKEGEGHDPQGASLPDIKDRLKYHDAVVQANLLLDEGRPQEALAQLQKIVAAVPDYSLARMFLGEALAKSGRLDEARQVFEELAQSEPAHGEAHARLGWILGRQGRLEEALAELHRALDLAPDTAEYRVNLGSTFMELNRRDEARELFQSAVAIDPACGNYEIAKLLASAGDIDGAVKHYKLTLRFDPNWIPLNTIIAVLLARQRKFDEAIEYAARAVELSPHDADVHYNLGFMYTEQGQFDKAVGPLEAALRLNPQHPKAAAQLNRMRKELKGRN